MMPKKKAGLVPPPPPGTLTLPPGFSTTAPSRVATREDMSVMDGSGSRSRSPFHSTTSQHDLPAIYSNEICPSSEVIGTRPWVQHCFSQYPQGKKVSYPLDKTEYLPPMRRRSITCTYGPHSPLHEAVLNETSLTPNMAQRSGISDWLPTDDGIQILPPSYAANNSSVRKVIDDHINFRLYSPSQKPRLPVFREFCP